MIQSQHVVTDYPTPEKMGDKKITMPGLGVNIARAIQMYSKGTIENQAIGYYEEKEMPIPDFGRMSKIEKLMALNEWREVVKTETGILQGLQAESKKREDSIILSNQINKKVDEKLKQQQQPKPDQ